MNVKVECWHFSSQRGIVGRFMTVDKKVGYNLEITQMGSSLFDAHVTRSVAESNDCNVTTRVRVADNVSLRTAMELVEERLATLIQPTEEFAPVEEGGGVSIVVDDSKPKTEKK